MHLLLLPFLHFGIMHREPSKLAVEVVLSPFNVSYVPLSGPATSCAEMFFQFLGFSHP
jgi:hypothetical protein